LAVLYEDEALLAVDKPSGLLVHRSSGARGQDETDNVVIRLAALGFPRAVAPVHRLDRATSGVLLCAKTPAAAAALGAAFAEGRVHKRYIALVRGSLKEACEVDHPVPRDEGGPRVEARTRITPVAEITASDSPLREQRYTLVRAEPRTGRFHQIRRHLKHLGHPVIGDANYGRSEHNRFVKERFGLARLALHAESIELEHPSDGRNISIRAALPPDLALALRAMKLD
jgi:tRNA pseudouridine65 synthase